LANKFNERIDMVALDDREVVNVFLGESGMGGTYFTDPIKEKMKRIENVVVEFVDCAKNANLILHSQWSFHNYESVLIDDGWTGIPCWHVILFADESAFSLPSRHEKYLLPNIFMFREKEFWQDGGYADFIKMISVQLGRRKQCRTKE
jgi:hypothetical protein